MTCIRRSRKYRLSSGRRADGLENPQLDPDAYATGISLSALHQAGVSVTGDPYQKGVAFLLKNQHKDGPGL